MIMPPCKSRQGPPDILSKYVKGAESPTYYIAGPPAMVQGLHAMLNKAGVANGHIRAEDVCWLLKNFVGTALALSR
jgi:NAD(P)H-flavin reductase